MLFSMVITLVGQPDGFWQHPEIAIRGDGLSIENETNHTFEFFLGSGWQAYFLANLIYFVGAFLLVSVLPKGASLITIFSFIFGHYFVGCNWLAVRWHFGMNAAPLYGIVISTFIAFNLFQEISTNSSEILKRLRWLMAGTIILDFANTLIGQPNSYWIHPDMVHEGNQLSRFFLLKGWYSFALYDVVYIASIFLLVSYVPKRLALILIFCFILIHFVGASCWFFYEWRMGMESPVILGIILSAALVWLTFYFKPRTT